ncbi:MAG: prepilin-type N-terminal cleavage/methylation domain-containing protein [Patescibacteria group bacterium]|nr:prepilin-type N-terminal cleavage/methylation domain-containing protein [Patescibacteria group bacterium]
MNNHSLKIKGFTLVEIMVSLSIFMIIMVIALGALVSASNDAGNARALRSAMDNVNFAMESMTRSLRTGSEYYCSNTITLPFSSATTRDCNGESGIAFMPATSTNQDTAYISNNGALQVCHPNCVDITSPDVSIDMLKFFVKGTSTTDNIQPSIYIIMKGTVTIKGVPNTFAIQTMVSQRSSE